MTAKKPRPDGTRSRGKAFELFGFQEGSFPRRRQYNLTGHGGRTIRPAWHLQGNRPPSGPHVLRRLLVFVQKLLVHGDIPATPALTHRR